MTAKDFLRKQSYQFKYNFAGETSASGRGQFHTRLDEMRKGEEKEEWAGHWFQEGPTKPVRYSEKMLEEAKRRVLEK
jgi:hypothetical protein